MKPIRGPFSRRRENGPDRQSAQRKIDGRSLSRFGAYLFAMNGDPRKVVVAAAQAYFAAQTRRAEWWEELREALADRVHVHQDLAGANKRLNAVVQAG